MANELHVFHDSETEWVVAESAHEARKILMETYGLEDDEVVDEEYWTQCPDDEQRIINMEDDDELAKLSDDEANDKMDEDPLFGWKKVSKTNKEWTEAQGKGILCTSEY